jgi:hypothetical protein
MMPRLSVDLPFPPQPGQCQACGLINELWLLNRHQEKITAEVENVLFDQ